MPTYVRSESAVFLKTKDLFGALSNMAADYPILINGAKWLTSEALYQACRFPDHPDVQELIRTQKSPMSAKMKSRKHKSLTRPDWFDIHVEVMHWCLMLKLAQNWRRFGNVLRATGNRPIVELSRRDGFWGAKDQGDGTLSGRNELGVHLMELRTLYMARLREPVYEVQAPEVPNFRLLGDDITVTNCDLREIRLKNRTCP